MDCENFVPYTLCDICKNACGFCSWSKKDVQKPVEGWRAIRFDIPNFRSYMPFMESYVVLDCPEYKPDQYSEKYPFDEKKAIDALKRRINMYKRMVKKDVYL